MMEKGWWRGRATGKTLHGKPREGDGSREEVRHGKRDWHGESRGRSLNLRHHGKTLHGKPREEDGSREEVRHGKRRELLETGGS